MGWRIFNAGSWHFRGGGEYPVLEFGGLGFKPHKVRGIMPRGEEAEISMMMPGSLHDDGGQGLGEMNGSMQRRLLR